MLLILAGVALATLTGQGNIIGNSENAVNKYSNSIAAEQQFLNEIEKYFQNYLEEGNNLPEPMEPPEVDENGLATENTIITTDEENIQIVIPKGFAPAILKGSNSTYSLPGQDGSVKEIMPADQWYNITAEQINQGIVIVDHAITYDGGQSTGTISDFNEYVWVSIPDLNKFTRTAWITHSRYDENGVFGSSNGKAHLLAEEKTEYYYWEEVTNEYTNMIDSVSIYKGFYIGRYEASNNEGIAQSKRNQDVWTYVTQETINAACESDLTENMHLIYGREWDSTLNWLIDNAIISSPEIGQTKIMELSDIQDDSGTWGNYYNSIGNAAIGRDTMQKTGYSEYWKANNIYDLAGNAYEWTQESYSNEKSRTYRGGFYNNYSFVAVATRDDYIDKDNPYLTRIPY